MKGRNYLLLNGASSYATIQPSQVEIYKPTSTGSTLCFIVVDALAMSKYWADYALYKGHLYERGMQGIIPDECPKHSVFGYREYNAAPSFEKREVKSQYLMVFE